MGSIDGYQRPAAAADFERCVQLLGTHPHDNELLAALTAIIRHHIVRSGMHALTQVVEMLRGSDGEARLDAIHHRVFVSQAGLRSRRP